MSIMVFSLIYYKTADCFHFCSICIPNLVTATVSNKCCILLHGAYWRRAHIGGPVLVMI